MKSTAWWLALLLLGACGPAGSPPPETSRPRPAGTTAPALTGLEVAPCAEETSNPPLEPARQVIQRRAAEQVLSLSYSPDGAWLAALSDDRSVAVWDVRHRALVRTFRPSKRPIGVMWGNEGEVLLETTPPTETERYRLEDGAPLGDMGYEIGGGRRQSLRSLARHPRGWLALASLGTLGLLDAAGRWHALPSPQDREHLTVDGFASTPDGEVVIGMIAYKDEMAVWRDLDAPPAIVALPEDRRARRFAFALARDRVLLATKHPGLGKGFTIAELPLGGGAARTLVEVREGYLAGFRLAPDGRTFAVATYEDVALYDATTGALRWRRPAERTEHVAGGEALGGSYASLAMSADGTELAVGRWDGGVRLLDARTGKNLGDLGFGVRASSDAIFAADDEVVTLWGQVQSRWSLARGDLHSRQSHEDWIVGDGETRRVFAKDGDLIEVRATGAGYRCARDQLAIEVRRHAGLSPLDEELPSHPLASWPPPRGRHHRCAARLVSLEALHDETGVAVVRHADRDAERPALLDLASGKLTPLQAPNAGLDSLMGFSFSPGGERLVAVSGFAMGPGGAAVVWEVAGGRPILETAIERTFRSDYGRADRKGVNGAALGPRGESVALVWDEHLELQSVPGGKPLAAFTAPARTGALSFAFGDDRLVQATDDGALRIVRGDRVIAEGRSDGGPQREVRASPAGTRLLSVGVDGAMRIWDAASARPMATLVDFWDEEWIAVAPGGAYRGTSEVAGRVSWVFGGPLEAFSFDRLGAAFADADAVERSLALGGSSTRVSLARPPRVSFAAPPRVEGEVVRVRIRASSRDRIDSVRLYAEGRPVAARALCAREGELELVAPLFPGESRLTLVAFDRRGFASNAVHADVYAPHSGAAPELWLVAVGVSRYPALPPGLQLEAADDDARALAAELSRHVGEGKSFAAKHVEVLLDDRVTVASVERALSSLSRMKPQDLAVVFFAGHGMQLDDGAMVLLTSAAGLGRASARQHGIGWQIIGEQLARARGRVLVLLDACHSGHISRELLVKNETLASSLMASGRAGAVVFAASKGRQLSFETRGSRALTLAPTERPMATGDAAHGYFTAALLEALRSADTDRDSDGAIQLEELIDRVSVRVSRVSRGQQTPWVARRELFGDFRVVAAPR